MLQTITRQQLVDYRRRIESGGVKAVRQVYAELYGKGYNYAGWAAGVANGDTVAGQAVLNYLKGTALMGMGGEECINLSLAEIDNIRVDMAEGYIKALISNADQNGGWIDRDVRYNETMKFHQEAFEKNNLSLENWTLYTPMELIRKEYDDQAVEDLWAQIRDTGGDGPDAVLVNIHLLGFVFREGYSSDPQVQQQAQGWLEQFNDAKEWLGPLFNAWDKTLSSWGDQIAPQFLDFAFGLGDAINGLESSMKGLISDLFGAANGNGLIDNGAELFGDHTILNNGRFAGNGFGALRELDKNRDGRVDSRDSGWASLKVWRDLNGNGKTDKGELLSMSSAGVKSLDTGYDSIRYTDVNGNLHQGYAGFTRTDGAIGQMADVWFDVDRISTQEIDRVAVSDSIAKLPFLPGFGTVGDLHQAMMRDSSGKLARLVKQLQGALTREQRMALTQQIIFQWTGVEDIASNSRGGKVDARKLAVVEAFMGEFFRGSSNSIPNQWAVHSLNNAYAALQDSVYAGFAKQGWWRPYLDSISIGLTDKGVELDFSKVEAQLVAKRNKNAKGALIDLLELHEYVGGSLGKSGWNSQAMLGQWLSTLQNQVDIDATLNDFGIGRSGRQYGKSDDEFLVGRKGSDRIEGRGGNDHLLGLRGNDQLYGGNGNDLLDGGSGNDGLYGGDGDDIYLFRKGSGWDYVRESSSYYRRPSHDVIRFEDVASTEVRVVVNRNDLVLRYGNGDAVRVGNYFYQSTGGANQYIGSFQFADGVTWTQADILKHAVAYGTNGNDRLRAYSDAGTRISGLGGNDRLYGGNGTDRLFGGAGSDGLYGGYGVDVLNGGAGNDYLSGGQGIDFYVFGRGHGKDVIADNDGQSKTGRLVFGKDIDAEDLWFSRQGYDLQIDLLGTQDRVTIDNWYYGGNYQLNRIRTASGNLLLNNQVERLVSAMAAFSPQAAANGSLTPHEQAAMNQVIAAAWTAA